MTLAQRRLPRVLCVGGAAVDRVLQLHGDAHLGTSNPATAVVGCGGVARNVAENLARLGLDAELVAAVGDDGDAATLAGHLADLGIDHDLVPFTEASTGSYTAVLDGDHELVIGVAAMDILERLSPAHLDRHLDERRAPDWLVLDCNLAPETLAHALTNRARGTRVAVDTVSVPKATRLPADLRGVDLLVTNLDESAALLARAGAPVPEDPAARVTALARLGPRQAVLTLGARGQAVHDGERVTLLPAVPAAVCDITGAGDALLATTVACLARDATLSTAVRHGAVAAALTTEVTTVSHPDLSLELIQARLPEPTTHEEAP